MPARQCRQGWCEADSEASHGIKYTRQNWVQRPLEVPLLRVGPTLKLSQVLQRVLSLAVFFCQNELLSSLVIYRNVLVRKSSSSLTLLCSRRGAPVGWCGLSEPLSEHRVIPQASP